MTRVVEGLAPSSATVTRPSGLSASAGGRRGYRAETLRTRDRRQGFRIRYLLVSEEQIKQWADEAEAGYDVDELKRRGRGRPGRGAEPMQVVAVRLTAEELDVLDAAALKHEMSRSEAIRAALANFAA